MLIAIRGHYLGQMRERRPQSWAWGIPELLCDSKALKQLPGRVARAEAEPGKASEEWPSLLNGGLGQSSEGPRWELPPERTGAGSGEGKLPPQDGGLWTM